MIAPRGAESDATTRIECHNTEGYNVKPGVHAYEFCPFCGHRITEGDAHDLIVSLPG
jgi:hypothetical protein